jgi:hypothetical protein
MAEHLDPRPEPGEDLDGRTADEVDLVLAALRELRKRVANPTIRACLDDARSDIAFLTAPGGEVHDAARFAEDDFEELGGSAGAAA